MVFYIDLPIWTHSMWTTSCHILPHFFHLYCGQPLLFVVRTRRNVVKGLLNLCHALLHRFHRLRQGQHNILHNLFHSWQMQMITQQSYEGAYLVKIIWKSASNCVVFVKCLWTHAIIVAIKMSTRVTRMRNMVSRQGLFTKLNADRRIERFGLELWSFGLSLQ